MTLWPCFAVKLLFLGLLKSFTRPDRFVAFKSHKDVDGSLGTFTSPVDPTEESKGILVYPNAAKISYRLSTPRGTRIELSFDEFGLEEKDLNTNLCNDKVSIFNGESAERPLVGVYCGTGPKGRLIGIGNTLYVLFESDETISRRGFVGNFRIFSTTVHRACHNGPARNNAKDGVITSPGYNSATYPPHSVCSWHIEAPYGKRIKISFIEIDLEPPDIGLCLYDYIQIYDGQSTYAREIGPRFCGAHHPYDVISQSPDVLVLFVSDGTGNVGKFKLQWSHIGASIGRYGMTGAGSDPCHGGRKQLSFPAGVIFSPKYPGRYPDNSNCSWELIVPEGEVMTIHLESLSLEKDPMCIFDSLTYFDESTLGGPLGGPYCGHTVPTGGDVTSLSNKVIIKFRSDATGSTSDTGFKLMWRKGSKHWKPKERKSKKKASGIDPALANCNFEEGPCNWQNLDGDAGDWSVQPAAFAKPPKPSFDHTHGRNGHYAVWEDTPQYIPGSISYFSSLEFSKTNDEGRCISFWYYMPSKIRLILAVYKVNKVGKNKMVWDRVRGQEEGWHQANITIHSKLAYRLIFTVGVESKRQLGQIVAIDDIKNYDSPCMGEEYTNENDFNCGTNIYKQNIFDEIMDSIKDQITSDDEEGEAGEEEAIGEEGKKGEQSENESEYTESGEEYDNGKDTDASEKEEQQGDKPNHAGLKDRQGRKKRKRNPTENVSRYESDCVLPNATNVSCQSALQSNALHNTRRNKFHLANYSKSIDEEDEEKIRDYGDMVTFGKRVNVLSSTSSPLPKITDKPLEVLLDFAERQKRILNGRNASVNEFPFIVRIISYVPGTKGQFQQCGGSIISSHWILTAAHCFEYSVPGKKGKHERLKDPSYVHLFFGEHTTKEFDGFEYRTRPSAFFLHPDRTSYGVAPNDIALMRMDSAIEFGPYVRPVCAWELDPDDDYKTGDNCYVIGWGKTYHNQPTARSLLFVRLVLISLDECRAIFADKVEQQHTCGMRKDKMKSSCRGDSGGPFVCPRWHRGQFRFFLHGVVSFGNPCGKAGSDVKLPGVFAKVQYFYKWMIETIKSNPVPAR